MPANVPAVPGEATAHIDLAALPIAASWARQFARSVLGLMLVQALSKEWSYVAAPAGKTVYCVISTG